MGISSFVLGGLLLVGYIAVTPNAPHRKMLMVVDIVAVLGSLFIIGPVGTQSLTAPWREAFFFAWSVGTIVIIAVAIGLDGGAGTGWSSRPLRILPRHSSWRQRRTGATPQMAASSTAEGHLQAGARRFPMKICSAVVGQQPTDKNSRTL